MSDLVLVVSKANLADWVIGDQREVDPDNPEMRTLAEVGLIAPVDPADAAKFPALRDPVKTGGCGCGQRS